MAFQIPYSLSFFVLLNILGWTTFCSASNIPSPVVSVPFNRSIFPSDFLFGVASAAYQYEGAWNVDGKGPSNWDTFTHLHPEKIADRSNGDVALDFYHRYKEDIKIAKVQGFNSFRLSIAWSRVLPKGKVSKGINWKGIDFYNRVINEIIAQGMMPIVTIFHWDIPQALEDEYLGFLSPKIVRDYVDFAEICFKYFGDRVKHWSTFNEPYIYSTLGYDQFGIFPPGRCSSWKGCSSGNSGTEPYLVAHNILRSHAAATNLYRKKYQVKQRGKIGIVLFTQWFEPFSKKPEDVRASRRGLDFMVGWFLNPVVYGDYPQDMKALVKTRLPKFTPKEKQLLRGSLDFLGMNYYTAFFAAHLSTPPPANMTAATTDNHINQTTSRNGVAIGEATGAGFSVPWGFSKLLLYVKQHYKNPTIYITECGMADVNITTVKNGVNDTQRVGFYKSHISEMHKAFKQGVDVKGFFAWSLHDNFEWFNGYTQRFGINFIDYKDNLKRYPKRSALWFKQFLLN